MAKLKEVRLFAIFDIPRINQVYLFYRARFTDPSYSPTAESSEEDLLDASAIPWGGLAFPVMTMALRRFLSARSARNFRVYEETIDLQKYLFAAPPRAIFLHSTGYQRCDFTKDHSLICRGTLLNCVVYQSLQFSIFIHFRNYITSSN